MSYDRRFLAYSDPAEDIRQALGLIELLPNGVAKWVESHGNNSSLAAKNKVKIKEAVKLLEEVLHSMPKSVIYEVWEDGQKHTFRDTNDLISWAERQGMRVVKYTERAKREELLGQPMFSGMLGPMYGGSGKVRYEHNSR